MSITKTLLAGVAGTVLIGSGALASEPMQLSNNQMDNVTAGFVDSVFEQYGGSASTLVGNSRIDRRLGGEGRETLNVRDTPPIFELEQEGSAFTRFEGNFDGFGSLFSFGSFVCVSNAGVC